MIRFLLSAALTLVCATSAVAQNPKFRHVVSDAEKTAREEAVKARQAAADSLISEAAADSVDIVVRTPEEILSSLPVIIPRRGDYSRFSAPWVFNGYRRLRRDSLKVPQLAYRGKTIYGDETPVDTAAALRPDLDWGALDSADSAEGDEEIIIEDAEDEEEHYLNPDTPADMEVFSGRPAWLERAIALHQAEDDLIYSMMVLNPYTIDYPFWALPEPVRLPDDDTSVGALIREQKLPQPVTEETEIYSGDIAKIHWLHTAAGSVQLSQAYISPNWYQGGNNNLALLVGMNWNVELNKVYHPKVLFNSALSYKLGIISTPQDLYHKYSVNQDIFQWNLTAGYKARSNWFYSFTAQFKTQFFNTYPKDSEARKASFLSPGDLTLGLGMTYSRINPKKTLKFDASISPLSYNLKTCIDSQVNPVSYGLEEGQRIQNQIGSTAELVLDWTFAANMNWKSRFFLFSDYKYFLGDWENTLSFSINRFLSTQIYFHLRYDSSAESDARTWKKWMLKEILSFGFAYTFSSK